MLEHISDKAVMKSQRAKALTLKEKINNFVLKLRIGIKRYHYELEKARCRRGEDKSRVLYSEHTKNFYQ